MSAALNPYQLEATSSTAADQTNARSDTPAVELCQIRKGTCFCGEIRGAGPLYIDGKVEGCINLPAGCVTVGQNGWVEADISAREIMVMGKVFGNILASDRVDIRAEGSIIGNVIAVRISIEDGAFLKGGIDVRLSQANSEAKAPLVVRTVTDEARLANDKIQL